MGLYQIHCTVFITTGYTKLLFFLERKHFINRKFPSDNTIIIHTYIYRYIVDIQRILQLEILFVIINKIIHKYDLIIYVCYNLSREYIY